MRSLFSAVFFATISLSVAAPLAAQCQNCPNKSPVAVATSAVDVAGKVAAKEAKQLPSLFNETCPVTGLPTGAQSPTIEHAGFQVSLCCTNCRPLFAKLDDEKKASTSTTSDKNA